MSLSLQKEHLTFSRIANDGTLGATGPDREHIAVIFAMSGDCERIDADLGSGRLIHRLCHEHSISRGDIKSIMAQCSCS